MTEPTVPPTPAPIPTNATCRKCGTGFNLPQKSGRLFGQKVTSYWPGKLKEWCQPCGNADYEARANHPYVFNPKIKLPPFPEA